MPSPNATPLSILPFVDFGLEHNERDLSIIQGFPPSIPMETDRQTDRERKREKGEGGREGESWGGGGGGAERERGIKRKTNQQLRKTGQQSLQTDTNANLAHGNPKFWKGSQTLY